MALKTFIPTIELDKAVTVFTTVGQFSGTVGENATPETVLTLHTQRGPVFIDIATVAGIRLDKTTI